MQLRLARVCASFVALLTAGCGAYSQHAAPPAPTATVSAPRAHPAARAPRATPLARATTASPRAAAGVRSALPAADPRPYILSANVSPAVVHSGTTVSAVVRTTPGVASVVAYAAGSSLPVPRAGAGVFTGSTTLPEIPSFVHGVFPVTFVARDRHGRTTQAAVSVTVP